MEETLAEEATEQNVEKALKEFKANPALQSALAIMPKSFVQVMDMAKVFAISGLVPDALKQKPEACAIAIMHGLELGVSPSQAVQNIMVVNGRATVWGDLMLALALGSNQLEFFEEDAPDVAAKQGFGRCVCKRVGVYNPVTRTFSLEDAKRAGLLTKDTWRNYPGRMLMYRARSWALRDCIPHVLKGLMMREEVENFAIDPQPMPMPQRTSTEHAAKRAETAPGGAILDAEVVGHENAGNASPAQSSEAKREDAGSQPTANERVDEAERKKLFKMRMDAKIPMSDTKAYLMKEFGVDDTARLNKEQAERLRAWFVKNAR